MNQEVDLHRNYDSSTLLSGFNYCAIGLSVRVFTQPRPKGDLQLGVSQRSPSFVTSHRMPRGVSRRTGMVEERVQRRLAAILPADVAGYSRLMGEDEEATLQTLKTYREVIDGLVANHHGRVFGSAGDSIIAEFASPVEAVRCATEIQHVLKERNAELPEERRMRFRIGVNLGDVMADGDSLFGDGVNMAARLEGLAEPGGICVSGAAYDHIKAKVDIGFVYLGEQRVRTSKSLSQSIGF